MRQVWHNPPFCTEIENPPIPHSLGVERDSFYTDLEAKMGGSHLYCRTLVERATKNTGIPHAG